MNPTINPLAFQSMRIGTKAEQQAFLNALSISLKEILGAISLLGVTGSVLANQLLVSSNSVASANTTINCANCVDIAVDSPITAASTLTLTNVQGCVLVRIRITNNSGVSQTFKLAIKNPSGASYTVGSKFSLAGAAEIDMTATGVSISNATALYVLGMTNSANTYFIGVLA